MKYLVSVTGLIILLLGCAKVGSTDDALVCHLAIENKQYCSPVLSLESGELKLDRIKNNFELTAHYDACFQAEDIKITGQYKQRDHKSIYNIELLAMQTSLSSSTEIEEFPRTIGLISLNSESKQGHFVDIWAMIRAHDIKGDGLEKVAVSCR